MEVESLTDVDLRKMLLEHGVAAGPVTDTTRNILQKKLSQVVSVNGNSQHEHEMESYTVEEVITTTSSTSMQGSDVADEYTSMKYESSQQRSAGEYESPKRQHLLDEYTPVKYESSQSAQQRSSGEYETSQRQHLPDEYVSGNYTPSTHTNRYARNSYPSGEDLRRRPLNTPAHVTKTDHKSAFTKTAVATTCAVEDKKISKGGWTCSRIFVVVLLVVILLLAVVYYHMENDDVKPLPAATIGKATTNQTG